MSGIYDTCGDDRFELIAKAKQKLLDATNIDSKPDEIAVLDNILFRCWQMGWLDRLRDADTRWHDLFGTPERAIAATLGSEREKALEELVQDWQELYENPDYGECVRLIDRMRKLGIEVEQ